MNSAPTGNAPIAISPGAAAALDRLVHAMGQPLTVLQACAVIPLRPLPNLPAAHAFIASMAAEVDRLTALYRDLRDLVETASPTQAPIFPAGTDRSAS